MKRAHFLATASLAPALALLALAPVRGQDAAQPAHGGSMKTPEFAVPPGAILGLYDPVTGKFSAASPEPAAIGQGKIIWQPRFYFDSGDAIDFPTIRCYVTVYSGSTATNNYMSASGSMDYDSISAPGAITLVFNYDTSLKANPLRIYAQCTAYDSNNQGHSWSKTKMDNADAGTIRYTASVHL